MRIGKYLFIIALYLISACSYSYFNKGFNEKRYFMMGKRELLTQFPSYQDYDVIDTNKLSLNAKKDFKKVIEKHFKIKRDHIKSKEFKKSFKYVIPTYYILNRWNGTIGLCDEYQKRFPKDKNNSIFLYYKGLSYLNLGDEKTALAIFDKLDSISINGNYMVYFYERLADVWLQNGSKTKSLNYLLKALGYSKKSSVKYHLYIKIANIYYDLKRYKNSIKYLKMAIELDQISIDQKFVAYNLMFNNYFAQKNYNKIFDMLNLLESSSDYGKYYNEFDFIKYKISLVQNKYSSAEGFLLKILLRNKIELVGDSISIIEDFGDSLDIIKNRKDSVNSVVDKAVYNLGKLYFDNLSQYIRAENVFKFYKRYINNGKYVIIVDEYLDKLDRYKKFKIDWASSKKMGSDKLFSRLNFLIFDMNRADTAISMIDSMLVDTTLMRDSLSYQKLLFTKYYILSKIVKDSLSAKNVLKDIIKISKKSDYLSQAYKLLNIAPKLSVLDSFNIELSKAQKELIKKDYIKAKDIYYYLLYKYSQKIPSKRYLLNFSLAYLYKNFVVKPDSSIYFYNLVSSDSLAPMNYKDISKLEIENYNKYKIILENR